MAAAVCCTFRRWLAWSCRRTRGRRVTGARHPEQLGELGGVALREHRERDLVTVEGAGRARVSLKMNEQLND